MEIFDGTPPGESMLVFCGLGEGQLDKLLAALRRNEVHVDFKAVQTPTNQQWSALRLYAEMEREKNTDTVFLPIMLFSRHPHGQEFPQQAVSLLYPLRGHAAAADDRCAGIAENRHSCREDASGGGNGDF